jgi:hypothetical protein
MPLSQQAQTVVDNFTRGLTADQRTNFNTALQNSPAMVAQINAAVASGDLTTIAALPPGTNAGGQYNPSTRTMELPLSIITSPAAPARYNAGELTFVMGHEIQHAINRPGQQQATDTAVREINRIGQSAQATHDYTQAINTRVAAHRQDEATAHIGGFNATVSMVRTGNQNPSLEDIYRANPARMGDFITVTPGSPQTYALRAGLTLNNDMTMTPNPANTEAMGRHFYDKPANQTRIGPNGDSNYQNYYATTWVGYAAQVERANAPTHAANGINTQMHINMNALGLNEAQLERNGLNLGGNSVRQPYFDTSTNPPTRGNFDHTAGVNRHVPIPMPDVPAPPAQGQAPGQPQHPTVRQAMDALDRSPNISADEFGNKRAEVATGMALHLANQKLQPDHIVKLDNHRDLVGVQGKNLSDPTALVSTPLPISQAIATDIPSAQRQLEALQPAATVGQNTPQPGRDLGQQDNPTVEAPKPQR